jgi:hypothetical protein
MKYNSTYRVEQSEVYIKVETETMIAFKFTILISITNFKSLLRQNGRVILKAESELN